MVMAPFCAVLVVCFVGMRSGCWKRLSRPIRGDVLGAGRALRIYPIFSIMGILHKISSFA